MCSIAGSPVERCRIPTAVRMRFAETALIDETPIDDCAPLVATTLPVVKVYEDGSGKPTMDRNDRALTAFTMLGHAMFHSTSWSFRSSS